MGQLINEETPTACNKMFLQWCRDELHLSSIFVQRFVSLDRTRLRKGTTAETQTLAVINFMKVRLLIIFSFSVFYCWGQRIKLETNNPAPRVGDEVTIKFTIEKKTLDTVGLSKGEKFQAEVMNVVTTGQLEISDWYLDQVGPLKIGPLQIPINGKTYTTNVLELTVNPELPPIENGIWIRLINIQDEDYLIYEQRRPMENKGTTHKDTETQPSSSADVIWATLDVYKLYENGIETEKESEMTTVQYLDLGQGTVYYRRTIYKCKFLKTFNGHLLINESFFINLLKNTYFDRPTVKN